jgi:hypothetical protein
LDLVDGAIGVGPVSKLQVGLVGEQSVDVSWEAFAGNRAVTTAQQLDFKVLVQHTLLLLHTAAVLPD